MQEVNVLLWKVLVTNNLFFGKILHYWSLTQQQKCTTIKQCLYRWGQSC